MTIPVHMVDFSVDIDDLAVVFNCNKGVIKLETGGWASHRKAADDIDDNLELTSMILYIYTSRSLCIVTGHSRVPKQCQNTAQYSGKAYYMYILERYVRAKLFCAFEKLAVLHLWQ
jgi:hypothetical protein